MPANLPPDYYAAERRYRETSDVSEKIKILREMLAIMPKHKGTEHLQGDLKRKISKLQSQAKRKSVKSRGSSLYHIPKEGAGQAVLVGPPNSGKSSILKALTNADTTVADYPFSTFKPVQGMVNFEDIQIQLVDLPPVCSQFNESWLFNIIRLSDLVVLVVDLTVDFLDIQLSEMMKILNENKIVLKRRGEKNPQSSIAVKSCLIFGTKQDLSGSEQGLSVLKSSFGGEFPVISGSVKSAEDMERVAEAIFKGLDVIRVYTKPPGKKFDLGRPYILPAGSTLLNAAEVIHKEFVQTMKYARIWGEDKYSGQRVDREYILQDRDVIEIHTR